MVPEIGISQAATTRVAGQPWGKYGKTGADRQDRITNEAVAPQSQDQADLRELYAAVSEQGLQQQRGTAIRQTLHSLLQEDRQVQAPNA